MWRILDTLHVRLSLADFYAPAYLVYRRRRLRGTNGLVNRNHDQ
jgi:hypothetical protein